MLYFDEFEDLVYDIADSLPKVFYRELSGGVIVKAESKKHPAAKGDDLWILGEYQVRPHLGRFVVLYYGSFVRTCRYLPEDALKEKVKKVILHEFRHHLEGLAGERDLEVEDRMEIASYLRRYS